MRDSPPQEPQRNWQQRGDRGLEAWCTTCRPEHILCVRANRTAWPTLDGGLGDIMKLETSHDSCLANIRALVPEAFLHRRENVLQEIRDSVYLREQEINITNLKEHMLRSASPRTMGFGSRQFFWSVLTAKSVSSE
jgi:hypothetical protein